MTVTPEAPIGWNGAELDTLATFAETIAPGDGVRRARLAAAALALAIDPGQVRLLRLVLRAFEQPAANLALGAGPVRFSELPPDARERYLLGWATSRIPQRRSAFQAFKRLTAFLAYADPGELAPNPRLAAIGYDAKPEPVTDEPTPIVPFRPPAPAGPGAPIVVDADVVVVGSGAGGGVVAAELAHAGRDVLVLEAGPFVPEPEMPTDELTAFDRLYLNHGLNASWDGSVVTLAGAGVGGGTTVNWMTSIAAPLPVRRAWAREHGLDGLDGPEADADLAVLEEELELALPPNIPPKDALIRDGCTALGLEVAEIRRNGRGCGDCGRCGFGCRRGAKRSGLRVHLAAAWRDGARILPDTEVTRVRIDGGRATGVDATVILDGIARRLSVRARQVVLAAGALRTPVVLQRSGIDHPATGRHLRLHPVAVLGARLPGDVLMWSGTPQAIRSLEYLRTGGDAELDVPGGFVIESAPGTPGLIALAFPWEGADRFTALMNGARTIAPMLGIVEDQGSGRVRATRSGHVRIDYRVDRRDAVTLQRALVAIARIAHAGGAVELVAVGTPPAWYARDPRPAVDGPAFRRYTERLATFSYAPNRGTVVSAHQMGSASSGGDPRRHACDPRGRVRAAAAGPGADRVIGGLYVADASLFPTAVGTNPMITTMLLARRVSRTVQAET